MIIITSKIFKKIGGNNYIENIQKDWWEYLDQKNNKVEFFERIKC